MRSSKLRSVGYFASTGILAAAFILGGAVDASSSPDAVAFLAHLGYPAYFGVLIGGWKVLGGLAILAPRFPRLKEWAYAGILFDLTGAAFSHAMTHDPIANVLVPVAFALVALASWSLRPAGRKLGAVAPVTTEPAPFTAHVIDSAMIA